MFNIVVNTSHSTTHPSKNHTQHEAHKDTNSPDAIVQLTLHGNYKRTYHNINIVDRVKVYNNGKR